MTCRQCGGDVPPGARFCPSCGQPLSGPGDERRVVTVVFADIVGFTTLSETLDPERVKRLVDSWFERLVGDITEFGGRVDKIVGDGILALFGAPVAHEDDAERAVRAALRMQETLAAMSARSRDAEAWPRVQMRIGVNTGEVLVGALRADGATTAMGDVVNTASRLQTAARPGEVLVGPTTHGLTTHAIAYEHRGLLTARGREAPVEAWAATCALVPPGQRPARDVAPLIGRARELGLLDAAVSAALGHSRAMVGLVVGDAGVGKTRLVREASERILAGREVLVLEGRCLPYGEANVWWPLAEALHAHCEVEPTTDLDEVGAAVWARVAAALGDEAPDPDLDRVTRGLLVLMGHESTVGGRDPARAREGALDAFLTFVEAHARRRPVVLVLFDVHWADPELLGLMERMSVQLARCPLVVLATARQVIRDRWSPPTGRNDALIVNLDPLDEGAASELLEALHGSSLPDELRDDLLARSGGNPFFLEELVALVDTGSPDQSRIALPDTLRGIVAARLDALSPPERTVLTDAAVLGRRGPLSALQEMGRGMHPDVDVDAAVETLISSELLDVDHRGWEFRSEVAREVAYRTLPKAERAKRHAGIAWWLEQTSLLAAGITLDPGAPRAEELLAGAHQIDDATISRTAHHWATAAELVGEMGDLAKVPHDAADRAVCWLAASGRRAQRRDLLPAAERAYDRAVALAGEEPVARRIRLLVNRARVRAERWDLHSARDDAEAALSAAAATADRSVEAAAILRLGDIDQRSGHTEAATARLRGAVHRFEAEGDERGRGEALRLLGMTQMFAGDLVASRATFDEAEAVLVGAGDVAGQGWVAQNRAWASLLLGDVAFTEVEVDRASRLFEEAGDLTGAAWAQGLLAFVRFVQGRTEEAEALAAPILDVSGGHGDRWATAMMRGLVSSLRLWEGAVGEAVRDAEVATQSFRDLGDPWGLSLALSTHGRALAMSGRVEDGFALLAEASEASRKPDGVAGVGETATVALAAQVGEPERVDDILARLAIPESSGTLTLPERDATLALLALQRGDASTVPDPGGRAFGLAVAALVHAARGEVEDAVAAGAEVEGCPEATYLDRAMAEVAAGLALIRGGRPDEGVARVGRAAAHVEPTDDRIGVATVALARAVAAEAAGLDSAVEARTEAALGLARLGLTSAGWETAFHLALGIHPSTPVG